MWMLCTLLYGVLKGVREIVKKKAMEKSTIPQVLFFYTLFGLIILIPEFRTSDVVEMKLMGYIALKSFVIFIAWIASFNAIKKIPISLYGILDLSRVLFATLLGVVVLKELLSRFQIIGLILVIIGLVMLKFKGKSAGESYQVKYIVFAFLSCLLNATSALMDKILTKYVTPYQLQFWYMLYLTGFYLMYLIADYVVRTIKCSKSGNVKTDKVRFGGYIIGTLKNYWIFILAVLFVIADRALFIANRDPASRITVMTLIKQSGCIVTILAGKFIFKESNIRYKLLCAFIIILGIVIAVL